MTNKTALVSESIFPFSFQNSRGNVCRAFSLCTSWCFSQQLAMSKMDYRLGLAPEVDASLCFNVRPGFSKDKVNFHHKGT